MPPITFLLSIAAAAAIASAGAQTTPPARQEIAELNFSISNMSVLEDTNHFIEQCRILREFRLNYLNAETVSREDQIEYLNGKDWCALEKYLRIIRGFNARLGEFPYQAWVECIRYNLMSAGCGGSLVTSQHVLTAAHCVNGVVLCKISLGLISLMEGGVSYYQYPNSITIHKDYNKNKYINDIAIIRLKNPAPITRTISPIRLAKEFQDSSTLSGLPAVISGWGKTRDDESTLHNYLQYARVRIMSENGCKNFYTKNFGLEIGRGHICTDYSPSNVCNGDSGGPLAILEPDNSWTLVGVVSLGVNPCEISTPSVFTAVASYLPWISQNIMG